MLVCIFAHPDDEAFGPGGAVAHFAKETEVHIICITNGDSDEKFAKTSNTDLGQIRRKELEDSAKILGVKNVVFLNFKDGTLCNNNYHDIAEKLKDVLDELKPDSVMTFDTNGVSGHIDHVVAAMATSYLFERLPYLKKLYYFCEKKIITDKMAGQYFIFFPPGYRNDEIDLALDVTPVWDQKLAAMKAHVSQRDDCDMILELFGDQIKTEYFRIWEK